MPEEEEFEEWLKVAEQRETYCRGRIELEEAKALDKKGEKVASSRRYHSASSIFARLAGEIGKTPDRSEMETLARFCKAWSQMEEAE